MKKALILFGLSVLFGRLLFAQVAVEGKLQSFDATKAKLKQDNGSPVVVPKKSIAGIKHLKTGDQTTAVLSAEELIKANPGLKH